MENKFTVVVIFIHKNEKGMGNVFDILSLIDTSLISDGQRKVKEKLGEMMI